MSEDINQMKEKLNDYHAQGEDYVRANPTQAVMSAVAAGFILRLLPIGAMVGALVRQTTPRTRKKCRALYKHFQGTQQTWKEH